MPVSERFNHDSVLKTVVAWNVYSLIWQRAALFCQPINLRDVEICFDYFFFFYHMVSQKFSQIVRFTGKSFFIHNK